MVNNTVASRSDNTTVPDHDTSDVPYFSPEVADGGDRAALLHHDARVFIVSVVTDAVREAVAVDLDVRAAASDRE